MIHYFCPQCWGEIEGEDTLGPKCRKRPSDFAGEDFPQKLMRALSHPERGTVLRDIRILGELRYEDAVAPLAALFDRSIADLHEKRVITESLGKIATEEAIKTILRALKHPSGMVRLKAVGALRPFPGRRMKKDLLKISNDPHPRVRKKAKEVLDELSILQHRLG